MLTISINVVIDSIDKLIMFLSKISVEIKLPRCLLLQITGIRLSLRKIGTFNVSQFKQNIFELTGFNSIKCNLANDSQTLSYGSNNI